MLVTRYTYLLKAMGNVDIVCFDLLVFFLTDEKIEIQKIDQLA